MKDFNRSAPISGPQLKMKIQRKNTLTYPLDEKTAKHRLNFLQFKPSEKTADKITKR